MTQKQRIIDLFNIPFHRACCAEICHILTEYKDDPETRYRLRGLNASVSSQLRKLVKSEFLEVCNGLVSIRGGMVYQKKIPDEKVTSFAKEIMDQI